jgi:hypothetical protein
MRPAVLMAEAGAEVAGAGEEFGLCQRWQVASLAMTWHIHTTTPIILIQSMQRLRQFIHSQLRRMSPVRRPQPGSTGTTANRQKDIIRTWHRAQLVGKRYRQPRRLNVKSRKWI